LETSGFPPQIRQDVPIRVKSIFSECFPAALKKKAGMGEKIRRGTR